MGGGWRKLHKSCDLKAEAKAITIGSEPLDYAEMNPTIVEIQRLLQEVVAHLSADTKLNARKAAFKLERIAALASTEALTIQVQR